jgi:hypothetical protein
VVAQPLAQCPVEEHGSLARLRLRVTLDRQATDGRRASDEDRAGAQVDRSDPQRGDLTGAEAGEGSELHEQSVRRQRLAGQEAGQREPLRIAERGIGDDEGR